MQKIMMVCIAALAMLAPVALAEESSTEAAYRSVAQAQDMFAINGTDAFEQISGSDMFDPFVFVLGTDDFVTVASSDFPELEGEGTFDPSQAGYTRESLLEHLGECDGLWLLHHFEPEPGVVLAEMLWLSEMGGYVFASGFFLPDLNLPEWLQAWYDEQLKTMVRLLNVAAGCECA
ncbi:MAG: hypothetical protein J4G04_08095 [Nitrosopumilaceae archaeon]|nr:hypothetical protein [Nitrosopumilaceae archaeon]